MTQSIAICVPGVTEQDRRLAQLSGLLGIPAKLCEIAQPGCGLSVGALSNIETDSIMISAAALGFLLAAESERENTVQDLAGRTRFLFVYGFRPGTSDVATLRRLTGDSQASICNFENPNSGYRVAEMQAVAGAFSGLTFGPADSAVDCGFICSALLSPIVSVDGIPMFATFSIGDCKVFLLGCAEFADLEAETHGPVPVIPYFSRLMPAIMFLKHAFGRKCWHSPRQFANFIIDDPLLREDYGFLNYRRLMKEMNAHSFATTIAFIPFNHRRTARSVADLFLSSPDKLSICVHGCDHTGGEFALNRAPALNSLAKQAIERMESHRARSTVSYDRVMVFPSGRFASASLKVLRANDYMAAVNTIVVPEDLQGNDHLTVADSLDMAFTRHDCFPIFHRRYPGDLVDFAFDLFMGKPILMMEHHTAFRKGYGGMVDFIGKVNGLCGHTLVWRGLGETLRGSYQQKEIAEGEWTARIYTNHQQIWNDSAASRLFRIFKKETGEIPIERVSVAEREVPFEIEKGFLRFSLDIPPHQSQTLRITYRNNQPFEKKTSGVRARSVVHVRRILSEFRDNFLSRHDRLLAFSEYALKKISR